MSEDDNIDVFFIFFMIFRIILAPNFVRSLKKICFL
jgi:hypothetical protein